MKRTLTLLLLIPLFATFCIYPLQSASAFTVGEERQVGEKLLYTVRSSFEVMDDPDLKQYVEKLGNEVIRVAGVQFFDYHFFIIKNKDFNAFAAPSGLIFFHSGLIEKVDSENELVSVIAHEVGHIVKRHISSRISKNTKISLATMGLVLASLALGGGAATEALMAGSMAAGQSASLHFSRQDEEEADLLAYSWMKEMKRHPQGQVEMLQTMRQIARYRSAMMPQYLLTHPNPEARLDYVQTLVSAESEEIEGYRHGDDFEFLRFKYRVLSQTKDSITLRSYFSSILASSRADAMDKLMARYGLSLLDRKENNFEQSLAGIKEVIDGAGEKNELMVDKGLIEFESGASKAAYATLTTAYDRDRSDMYAAFSLAKVCFHLGMNDKAERLFKDVMYRFPEFSQVYYELGRLSAAQAKTAEPHYYLGRYYLIQGKLDLAKNKLDTALADKSLAPELETNARQALDLIARLKK